MLENVALGQSRFVTPGVAPDPRGVVLGRYGVLLFPTLEGVVSWFRLYSAESSLDELLAGMAIHRVRTPLGSREMLVRMPATSSYAMDRAARCARLVGGVTFTGTAKHFVQYRDDRSPYGYDAVDVQALPQGTEFMLHGVDFAQAYARDGDLGFDKLLFRLSLRRIPGGEVLRTDERQELLLVVARGLGDGVIRYLWRNRVDAEAALVSPRGDSAFTELGGRQSYLVIRARELPQRILDLFVATPGIDVFRSITPQVAVQVGWAHPIDLSSCASVFDASKFYLFWGGGDRVDVIDGPLEPARIEHLTKIDLDLGKAVEQAHGSTAEAAPVGVAIRLSPSLAPPRRVIAALVPGAQAAWLKRLVYFLPPTALRGHRVAVTDRGVLLVASEDIDVVPLGQLLSELAPGLLVPLGMDVVPRVSPDVLARALGHGSGLITVFPHEGGPFQVQESALVPLERRALAKVEVERAEGIDLSVAAPDQPSVWNQAVGRFALWGFKVPEE
ncbi:MAG TPA: hypothetical protein VL172_03095 [Kofleriaceae bacterium]|jgi:hypothetical protein|nr:hypothetical protein [Kofleriaceae bacterium]